VSFTRRGQARGNNGVETCTDSRLKRGEPSWCQGSSLHLFQLLAESVPVFVHDKHSNIRLDISGRQ